MNSGRLPNGSCFRLCASVYGATLNLDSSSVVPLGSEPRMSSPSSPPPGQRWRSLIDGHTVVTGDGAGEDAFWIRYDDTWLATAIDHAGFFDDYEFVEIAESSSWRVVTR